MTEGPWMGVSLALSGAGITCFAGATTLASALTAPTVTVVLTYTIELTAGVVVATSAILAFFFPRHPKALGYVVATFSLLSLFRLSGAWCFGSMLGTFGAAALLVWSLPFPAVYRPAEAFAIATAIAAIGPYPLRKFPPLELLPGVVAEGALLIGRVMVYRKRDPHRRQNGTGLVNMLSRRAGTSAERLQGRSRDRQGTCGHAAPEPVQPIREFCCVPWRQDEDALPDPHDAGTVDESPFAVPSALGALRDPSPAEHDLADPRRDGPRGTGDIVRQQDSLAFIPLNRHHRSLWL